jgi:septin family protein
MKIYLYKINICLYFIVELQETNVRLKLTVCDSVGFGDQINKEDR